MPTSLSGVLGPVVSTFDAHSGELDPTAFCGNVRAHLADGLAGIVIAGSTGEAALLEERERDQLVEWARPLVSEDRWLVVGVGAESTRLTLRGAREAAERGADAVLVVAPHYYGAAMTHEALLAHYRRVADESPVPVILYNIPKYVHFALSAALVGELATHEQIIGIKDSSGDPAMLGAYVQAQSPEFAVLTGHGGSLCTALEMGAQGGVLAVSLFTGSLAVELTTAFAAGDAGRGRARRIQETLAPLNAAIVGALGVAGVKGALDAVGLAGGSVRAPLLPLRAQDRSAIDGLLRAAELPQVA
ncbi:MAG TPA: dihydrodipicolinate synthase family protein [Gemmatimonadaceae bacterium]|nr:dihydrodipicolinate synthase family protein [Gemmatimonadaceae bacterium]